VSWAPDYAQPISGWRVWLVAEIEGKARLVSVFYHVPWPVRRELAGECLAEPRLRLFRWRAESVGHPTPAEGCRCGIYAAREPSTATEYLRSSGMRQTRKVNGCPVVQRVLGRVRLWGQVVECDAGWRAARAYPERLFLPEKTWNCTAVKRLDDLALDLADYGIPVEILDGVASEEEIMQALQKRAAAA
jgi:hypothetical protein